MPLDATHHVEGDRLVIDAIGTRNGLKVTLRVALSLPGDGRIEAVVDAKREGTVVDPRPGEAFKPVNARRCALAAGPAAAFRRSSTPGRSSSRAGPTSNSTIR